MPLRPAHKLPSLLAVAAALLLAPLAVHAQEHEPPIKIYVDSILATYSPGSNPTHPPSIKMDARLNVRGISDRLRMMFAYNDYQLKRSQEAASECGGAVAFNLPDGNILHVAPITYVGSDLAMALSMFEGQRLIMQMPVKMLGGGMLLLVDDHGPGQFYITAVSADSPILSHLRASPGLMPDGAAPVQIPPALVPPH